MGTMMPGPSNPMSCGVAPPPHKSLREQMREHLRESIGLPPEPQIDLDKYCQHTGWWVRMMHPNLPCPDCKKHLSPEYR